VRGEDCVAHPTRRHILRFASLALPALLGGCGAGGMVGRLTASWFDDLEPGGDGYALYRVRRGDTLVDLAPRYRIGYVELAAANPGVDPWQPAPGTKLAIPTTRLAPRGQRKGLVVNLADMRLYHFPGGAPEGHYPIGIGRDGHPTPLGTTRVVRKAVAPTWYPPPEVRAEKPYLPAMVLPGPDNPLGGHALYLGWPTYLIHGTNLPGSVGRHASNGCLRLYEEHIAALHAVVPVGTPVRVVHDPIKMAMEDGDLWLEAHPSLAQADELEERYAFTPEVPAGIMKRIAREAGPAAGRIDWELIKRLVLERRGCATRVTIA
jgi:L,D-transpeptidase ErfK/SrfK